MQAWRLRPQAGVDPWERQIRDWIKRQTKGEPPPQWNNPHGSILWNGVAEFLQRHIRIISWVIHLFVGRLFRKMRHDREAWPTFEEVMAGDSLSAFGACVLAMWLLDSTVPADTSYVIGIAERFDGKAALPVVIVFDAGVLVIDPTTRVTGLFPKKLSKLKRWKINRCFDWSGSYSLVEVVAEHPGT